MANTVVWYHSEEAGAPVLNNAAGSLIAVLDACLEIGFNSKSVTSIVVLSGVATVTVSSHGYEPGKMLDFAGASPGGLNGRKKIITCPTNNTLTFDATGIGDQTATGTITCKRSPLGWTKEFSSGTTIAVYKRNDVAATAMKLRIDDTGAGDASATHARAVMYETMSGHSTGASPTPTAVQLAGGQYWTKGGNNTTAKQWILVGDSRTFYLYTDDSAVTFATYQGLHGHGFGDMQSYRTSDAYGCMLIGGISTSSGSHELGSVSSNFTGSYTGNCCVMACRDGSGIGSATKLGQLTMGGVLGNGVLGGIGQTAFPSGISGGMIVDSRLILFEASGGGVPWLRGHPRGLKVPLANLYGRVHKQVFSGVSGFPGELLSIGTAGLSNPQYTGCLMFDITGPW